VFAITGRADEDRREPKIPLASPIPLLSPMGEDTGASIVVTRAEAGAHAEMGPLRRDDGESGPPDRDPQVRESWWVRLRGPIGSLVLHLLPLLLLLNWQMVPPPEAIPIAVQLVMEPPPPQAEVKPPPPQPGSKPPSGRLASDDFGNPDAKKAGHESSEASASKDAPTPPETPPSETPPQKTAAIVPPPPEKPNPPKDATAPAVKPLPKPNPVVRQMPRRVEETAHAAPRRARFPGTDATRDEYLAYLLSLIEQHFNLLPLAIVGDRRGVTMIKILVLDDGTIARLRVGRSSGYQDIDSRIEQIIVAVGHFPPLPQWFQGDGMEFEFELHFPEGLRR
jgi:outer membrane biosynthesis protein TonB